jgi:hypothetical protein
MTAAMKLAVFASGAFFLTGLLTGVWKFRWMAIAPKHQAPPYVDIAHRAALMYSFACLVIAKFLEFSPFSETVNLASAGGPIAFFAIAVGTYVLLGHRNETSNQFEHPSFTTTWGMWILAAVEILGFSVLFYGFAMSQLFG